MILSIEEIRQKLAELASAPVKSAADASARLSAVIDRMEDEEAGLLPEELAALAVLRAVKLFLDTLE